MENTPTKPGEARILFINLSTGSQEVELFDESVVRKFIGGYGLAAKIIFDRQKAGIDPMGADNMLGFFT